VSAATFLPDLRQPVRHVAIPRQGKPGKARQAAERRPAFRPDRPTGQHRTPGQGPGQSAAAIAAGPVTFFRSK
jgi:hypothetical protein